MDAGARSWMWSLLQCPTRHDRCGHGWQLQTLKWQHPHLVSSSASWWPGLWWDGVGNKRGGFLMCGHLESCSSEKRRKSAVDCSVAPVGQQGCPVWAAGVSCPPEIAASRRRVGITCCQSRFVPWHVNCQACADDSPWAPCLSCSGGAFFQWGARNPLLPVPCMRGGGCADGEQRESFCSFCGCLGAARKENGSAES